MQPRRGSEGGQEGVRRGSGGGQEGVRILYSSWAAPPTSETSQVSRSMVELARVEVTANGEERFVVGVGFGEVVVDFLGKRVLQQNVGVRIQLHVLRPRVLQHARVRRPQEGSGKIACITISRARKVLTKPCSRKGFCPVLKAMGGAVQRLKGFDGRSLLMLEGKSAAWGEARI
eukprot:236671-Prorocentrum_minimum.AAC.5